MEHIIQEQLREFTKSRQTIEDTANKVNQMFTIIVGNEHDEDSGMIKKLQHFESRLGKMEGRVNILEVDKIKAKAYVAAFISAGGIIGWILKTLLDHYLK